MNFGSSQALGSRQPISGWRVAIALLALLLLSICLAAVTSAVIVRFMLPHLPVAWARVMTHRGTGKIMVRAMQVWLVVLLPLLLRFSGWQGWRDCGWQYAAGEAHAPRVVWKDVFNGVVVGMVSLGGLALFMLATNRRWLSTLDPASSLPGVLLWFALSASAVALFEETLARGIIFRLWARAWGVVPAAVLSSLLFAAAHFLEPPSDAFNVPGWGASVWALASNLLPPDIWHPAVFIQFLNLTCLGLVLCAMVRLTGSIWLAVGAHAGWVWSIKLNNFFTDALPVPLRDRLWGARGDLTDSLMGTATLLSVLLIVVLLQRRQARQAVVCPARGRLCAAWLGLGVVGVVAAVVIDNHALPKHWGVVEKNQIFRSDQLAPPVLWKMLRTHHIVAVLELDEERGSQSELIKWIYRHLSISRVVVPLARDGTGKAIKYVDALDFLACAWRENRPVLVLGASGSDGAGGVVAAFRMLIQGADVRLVRTELEQYGWRVERNPVLLSFLDEKLPAIARGLKSRNVPVHAVRTLEGLATP